MPQYKPMMKHSQHTSRPDSPSPRKITVNRSLHSAHAKPKHTGGIVRQERFDAVSGEPEPNRPKFTMSRRTFVKVAVGVGAVAAVGGGAAIYDKVTSKNDEISVLEVPENAVTSSDDLKEMPADSHMGLNVYVELPYGSLVWASNDSIATCFIPRQDANPLVEVAVLHLGSGYYDTVLKEAVNAEAGYQIYAARASKKGLIWVESNILQGGWRVYTATLKKGTLGKPVLADEQDSEWELPTLAAVDDVAFWQVLPDLNGSHTSEASIVKRVHMGETDVAEAISSMGRMCTPIYAMADSIVVTPRTNTDTVHHQLTRINAQSLQVLDTMVLPTSMKPLEAGYGETGFTFAFDAIYNYGDGIANLGSYAPMTMPTDGDYSSVNWFRFARSPYTAPAWCGKYLMVKSTTAVCGIDLEEKKYFVLEVKSGSDSYGDYLASTGSSDTLVTYANIDDDPINGKKTKCCLVRIWSPVG